jgi:hypothetical protein
VPTEVTGAKARYVLSCAAITAASRLLVAAHGEVGAPNDCSELADIPLRMAVAQARTGAGAMSVVAGRLLTRVRQDEAVALPGLESPVRAELGVTTAGTLAGTAWRTTTRAMASAAAECSAALTALERCDASDELCAPMRDLVRIVELMAGLEPPSAAKPSPNGQARKTTRSSQSR